MTASYLPGHYFPGTERSIKILDYAANEWSMITSTLTFTDGQKDRDYNTLSSFIKAKKLSILIIEGKHHILYQASDADGNRYYRN